MSSETQRQKLIKEIFRRLGGGMVKIELTPEHYDDALDTAINTYRQRSGNSTEERFTYLDLKPDVTEYNLPDEVIEVRQILRNGVGGATAGGTSFEPFSAQINNQLLLGSGSSSQLDLVTYELFTGFQDLVATMFGAHIMFTWVPSRHQLTIMRRPRNDETVMLWLYITRPEDQLLTDPYARPWILRYALAICKQMLGEARSRFGTFIGPQGGTTLNGDQLKNEAQIEMDNLLLELQQGIDVALGYGFIVG